MSEEIFYSRNKIHKPTRVTPLEDYILYIEYDDGIVVHFDVKELFKHPLFKPLEDKILFQKVRINGSSICWDGDIDICADSIYSDFIRDVWEKPSRSDCAKSPHSHQAKQL